ncbi:hypothetical protein CEXT_565501 [Caerostris extrusa]|uniref:Uncharacterized protein n=1 Tax=Caerostris extrusa TaxID=172846 RepID=A0AAV4QZY1_CAEEX|nr:hypothetical protein CEXT_565501 [Caerostris extrusa]
MFGDEVDVSSQKMSTEFVSEKWVFSNASLEMFYQIFVSSELNIDPPKTITYEDSLTLYINGELFSFIGGLMGCWLGISVWALTDIIESTLFKVLKLVPSDTSRQPVESNL